ncbi:hypothetical protein [Radiobacillus deserti]|nr:hypothetical protein [Radiobacillus deserti]
MLNFAMKGFGKSETNHFQVIPEKMKGKTIEDIAIKDHAVVIKFYG